MRVERKRSKIRELISSRTTVRNNVLVYLNFFVLYKFITKTPLHLKKKERKNKISLQRTKKDERKYYI